MKLLSANMVPKAALTAKDLVFLRCRYQVMVPPHTPIFRRIIRSIKSHTFSVGTRAIKKFRGLAR